MSGGVPCLVSSPFDSDSVFERHPGADESAELGAVDLPPPVSSGVEELVGHHQATASCAGAFGDFGAGLDGGERRSDIGFVVRRWTQCGARNW